MTIPAIKKASLKTIQKSFSWAKSIEKDTSVTKKGEVEVVNPLKEEENLISGKEMESRFEGNLLGFQHALYFKEHQEKFNLDKELYYLFPGTVLTNADGRRYVACLYWDGGRWYLRFIYLERGFRGGGRVLRARKSSKLGSSELLEPKNLELSVVINGVEETKEE